MKLAILNYDSVLQELKAAYAQNKKLKAQVAKLEREIQDLKDLISKTYDAQNG